MPTSLSLPTPAASGDIWGNQLNNWLNAQHVVFNVRVYGAVGDGVTDDTTAIQNAVNAWVSASYATAETGAVLLFPPGNYKTTNPISVTYTANSSLTKLISGYGARLKPTFSVGHALDISVTSGLTRNLTIEGLMLYGGGLSDTSNGMLHLGGGTSPNGLYRCVVRDVTIEGFSGHGIVIDGWSFEHAIVTPHIDTSNTVGSGIYVLNAAGGGGSSIDIYGGTISGGLHNVYGVSPQIGLKIYGGTYLQAYNNAIYMDGSTEGAVYGAHIENAWQGGVASPSWATTQAGIYAAGRVTISGVTGNCGNSKMRYVARIFASPEAAVVGGAIISGCDYYVRAEGAASANLSLVGCPKGVTGVVDNGMPSTGRIVQIGCDSAAPVALTVGAGLTAGQYVGSGSPNSVVSAGPGSTYVNTAGGASTTLYVKESGTGNTGWVAK